MNRAAWLVPMLGLVLMTTGCVTRRVLITSDPPGAVVYVNNQQIGATPADNHFVYYGNYEFLLVKEGYQTKREVRHIAAPWYEYFPIDFFAENIWPYRQLDVRRFNYDLEPLPAVRTDVLLDEAQNLRLRGQAITPPPSATPLPPPIVAPPASAPIVGAPPQP